MALPGLSLCQCNPWSQWNCRSFLVRALARFWKPSAGVMNTRGPTAHLLALRLIQPQLWGSHSEMWWCQIFTSISPNFKAILKWEAKYGQYIVRPIRPLKICRNLLGEKITSYSVSCAEAACCMVHLQKWAQIIFLLYSGIENSSITGTDFFYWFMRVFRRLFSTREANLLVAKISGLMYIWRRGAWNGHSPQIPTMWGIKEWLAIIFRKKTFFSGAALLTEGTHAQQDHSAVQPHSSVSFSP